MPHRELLAAALVAALAMPTGARGGDVRGTIRWIGPPPAARSIATSADRTTCGDTVPDESLIVSDGGLENVVVRIEVPGARAQPRALTLDQQGCRYRPRTQAAAPGSTLRLGNGDPVLHNVHGWLGPATAFNVPMPERGGTAVRTLSRPGVVRVGCDVHAWMSASIVVAETPFVVVTGPGGRFAIAGVPPGSWQAVAWHERLGERRAVVVVAQDGEAALDFSWP